jgi:hypothetical protein
VLCAVVLILRGSHRCRFNLSRTKDGEHALVLDLAEDVEASSSTPPTSVLVRVRRVDLLPTLSLLDKRMSREMSFFSEKEEEEEKKEEEKNLGGGGEGGGVAVKSDHGGEPQHLTHMERVRLETVEAARARMEDLSARPARTLQDLCSVVCMLDNQTLADFSHIFRGRGGGPTLRSRERTGVEGNGGIGGNGSSNSSNNSNNSNNINSNKDDDKPVMTRRSALLQASPTRSGVVSQGTTSCSSFRRGIVTALLQRGFQAPTEEALSELVASMDEEERGEIRFASLSGILIGGKGAAEGSTKYRRIMLTGRGGGGIGDSSGRTSNPPEPLEGTKIVGHPDDALTQVCVVRPAAVRGGNDETFGAGGGGARTRLVEEAALAARLHVKEERLRLCSLTPTGRTISIFDVHGDPKEDMSVELIANVSMQTPDRLKVRYTVIVDDYDSHYYLTIERPF